MKVRKKLALSVAKVPEKIFLAKKAIDAV